MKVSLWCTGQMPTAEVLAANGVQTFAAAGQDNRTNQEQKHDSHTAMPVLVPIGPGFQALPKKLVEKITANEYIDFAELPPAKGKSRPVPQSVEGQVLVVQAADLMQSRRIIPDLATWSQCFALYVAVLAPTQPERIGDLMAYQALIAKASLRYKWPSWVVYDQNFRQEVAGKPNQTWGKVDPSTYTLCFTGQALSAENWCSRCQCLDHTAWNCPVNPKKRQWSSPAGAPPVK